MTRVKQATRDRETEHAVEMFVRREDAEAMIEDVRRDDAELERSNETR